MTTLTRYVFGYELEDGTLDEVRVLNRSLIAWDETRAKRQWPSSEDAPNLWQTFIVWHALTRAGRYSKTFETFQDECLGIEMQDAAGEPVTDQTPDDQIGEPVDPTRPSPEPESSSGSASQLDRTPPAASPGGTRTTP